MTVNERIRQVRKALKLSQAQFAKAMFISNGYIAELECGHKNANDRIIHFISVTFGVSEAWLKTGEGAMLCQAPDEKLRRMTSLFNELPPKLQDYALAVIDQLAQLQRKPD
jgi:transcriptional regulator with XRE-family HTH domain